MKLTVRIAAAILLCIVIIAGCGSTRFVLVQNSSPGGAAAPTTTVAGAAASKDDLAAIRKLVETTLSTDPKGAFADREPFIINGDDLGPTADAVQELVSEIEVGLTVDDVTASGDDGTAIVSVTSGGQAFASGVPVAVKRVDGEWMITRDGACAVLSLGSPCPER